MVNWTDIHKDFGEKTWWNDSKTYQQYWEENNLTYQDAQEWIQEGFEPSDCNDLFKSGPRIKQWKNLGFTPKGAKEWVNSGLNLDYFIINHNFANVEITEIRNENTISEIRNKSIIGEKINKIKRLCLNNKGLVNSLFLTDFIDLERLDGYGNKITK